MSKILVTGGAGFIGSHLVQRLLTEGFDPVVVDCVDDYYDQSLKKANIALFKNEVNFYKENILDKESIAKIFKKEGISKIIHMAARGGVRPSLSNPIFYNEMNTMGTIRLLKLAKEYKVEQFIFGSTSSIYGTNKVPFKESDPVDNQLSPYAISKRAAEIYCKFYAQSCDIPTTCLRFFTVYGARQRPEMAIHKFTSLMYQEKPIPMFGDGSTSRDYTYISDIVDGVMNALFVNLKYEIINLGNSSPINLKGLIEKIENAIGKKAIIENLDDQPGDMEKTYADINKASNLLNYKPKVSLDEGLKKFNSWFKEHQS